MTILVTGATGGVAKQLLPLLQGKFREDIVLTARNSECLGPSGYVCDLSIPVEVTALVKKIRPRLIIHLAGSFSGDFNTDFAVNALSVKYVYEAILAAALSTRVVVMGSAAEYGVIGASDNPVKETQNLNPISVYGLTKSMQTHFSRYYYLSSGIDTVCARVFNVLAPGLSERLFVGRLFKQIELFTAGEIKTLSFGNLSNYRDYIDVAQFAEQLFAICQRAPSGEIYHVASGVPIQMRILLQSVLDKFGVPFSSVSEVSSDQVGKKGFDIPIIYSDNTKINSLL